LLLGADLYNKVLSVGDQKNKIKRGSKAKMMVVTCQGRQQHRLQAPSFCRPVGAALKLKSDIATMLYRQEQN